MFKGKQIPCSESREKSPNPIGSLCIPLYRLLGGAGRSGIWIEKPSYLSRQKELCEYPVIR